MHQVHNKHILRRKHAQYVSCIDNKKKNTNTCVASILNLYGVPERKSMKSILVACFTCPSNFMWTKQKMKQAKRNKTPQKLEHQNTKPPKEASPTDNTCHEPTHVHNKASLFLHVRILMPNVRTPCNRRKKKRLRRRSNKRRRAMQLFCVL